ncbi:hypothetical protein A6R68_17953 [Neotoma lepida]|uniref:Secreted protein n=1 Tax=Neotoma lepida TaxID=56216 RepID=A0A1A6HCF5_NEOLE|nr:hypothetical protein A6R68_17953 [Neotoma lepida]
MKVSFVLSTRSAWSQKLLLMLWVKCGMAMPYESEKLLCLSGCEPKELTETAHFSVFLKKIMSANMLSENP